jgi:phage tail sheath gpL-like
VTITSSVPTSLLRPNTYHEFIHTPAGRGLVPITQRVALIGTKSSAGTATVEQPVQVFDALDADTKAGQGSPLALMARKAIAQGKLNASLRQGGSPEIWIVPVAAPGGGAAQTKTLTFSGPATASGNIELRIAGRTIFVGVTSGDSANTMAAATEKAIDARAAELPVTAGVATNVVTCTATVAGENGTDIVFEVVAKPSGVGIVVATGVAGSGVIDITAALDALVDKDYHGIAIENRKSADVTDAKAHTAVQWGFAIKRFRWVFMGDASTLSTANTNSVASNDKTVLNILGEASPSLHYEIAAAAVVAAFGTERPNANLDDVILDIYPPPAASALIDSEIESALASGTTPLVPTPEGDRMMIVRMVTTKTLEGGVPFEDLRDLAYSRTAAYMATQYDIGYRTNFRQEYLTTDPSNANNVLKRVRDMVIDKQRAAEELEYIQNVDDYLAELQVEKAPAPLGRIITIAPIEPVSPLHQGAFVHVVYL